ncbi:endonuclease/exonuclease/phosphatase family protein [Lacticaseibacillus daqingensis]|uniref:endonuclease/exonuclease/phosphatase family protein n=1 Tax=Lacticaseibacillus daqingensis TaxID=2486014 RepID=UPI000F79B8FA|nr:endonuclease/exonuclease/phosphatase family protein [Lacticaseibacillus daqingensis]
MKRLLKGLAALVGLLILAVGGYVAYLFLSYHRLPDDQALKPVHHAATTTLAPNTTYTAMTYNIGYGSYPPSYSFFMSGGKYSRAYSAAAVRASLAGVVATTEQVAPDVAFYQEVDVASDRARQVNEVNLLGQGLPQYSRVFGQNYDSAYLFYPFTRPIGRATSGLMTLSRAQVLSARRYQLAVDSDYNKLMDLDRAFTVTRTPVQNGKQLVLVNIHMSAFTPNKAVHAAQFKKLFAAIEAEYAKGNYVMVGGDYNHRLLKNAAQVFDTKAQNETWTQPFPFADLPAGFHVPTAGLAAAAVPSARELDAPYRKGKTFVTLIDGFILSPNIEAHQVKVVDTGFTYSDHNPVRLTFSLKP